MRADWYPGIQACCSHWRHTPMLQQTLDTLEREFADDSDASIDAAKALVECACRLLVEELDDPAAPLQPAKSDIPLAELLGLATRMLDLGEVRDRAFATLIKAHNRLADALRVLRNEAGTVSHGKDGFIRRLSVHHRRAALLAADAIVTFLHAVEREDRSFAVAAYVLPLSRRGRGRRCRGAAGEDAPGSQPEEPGRS